jgi:hypothetical protein
MKKLTKSQMRVAIAKDALAQLRAEKYVATKNVYIDDTLLHDLYAISKQEGDVSAHPFLNNLKSCKVCAKGAIYLSTVRNFNDVTLVGFNDSCVDKANSIFGEKNLFRIESAFERWKKEDKKGRETNSKLNNFINKYPDKDVRLEKILLNIIRNKGVFKP